MPDLRSLPLACPVVDTGCLIRGHPDVVPTKVGNHLKDWIPVFTRNAGFWLEFVPMEIWVGMTTFLERGSLWIDSI